MPDQLNAVVTVQRNASLQALIEQLLDAPSGVYLVTIHQGQVKKIARLEKEIVIEPAKCGQTP